jgi:phage-related protein
MKMIRWRIEILNERVEEEINDLPQDMRARLQRIVELLIEFGPHKLGEPYIKPLKNKLWEIRCKGKDGIGRVIYIAASGRRLVILHAFIKKTQKTPEGALKLALTRMKEIKNDV